MPPKPLPLRDGRLGSSSSHIGSSQLHNEPYYSNEDIKLLHEIVTTGEEIYPTLPERDRLPTNALFHAAEQVLPAHGYDPDHAPSNISRLIFKIGGLRSEGSLMDKFSSVLGGMGINLEIVESPEEQHLRDSSSVKSSVSAAVDRTGTFSLSPRYDARRRRNSESAAPTGPVDDLRSVAVHLNGRPRSASFGPQPGDDRFDLDAAGDENRPPRQSAQVNKGKTRLVETEDTLEQHPRPLPHRPRFMREDETDDGFPYRRREIEEYPVSETEHVEEYAPSEVYRAELDLESDSPRNEDAPGNLAKFSDMAHALDRMPTQPVLTVEDREFLEEDVQSHQTEWAHRKAAIILSKWNIEARKTAQRHQHQEAQAAERDTFLVLSECIEVWRDTAEAARSERIASQGPIRDPDEDDSIWRKASKGYNLFIVNKAFCHWWASTRDEVERTAIARRHILRKRYFLAWRSHQADIETKIRNFRLGTLLRVWRRAAIHHDVRDKVAVQRYRHSLVKNAFYTWYGEHRAQLADDLWACRLKERCMSAWIRKTEEMIDNDERAFLKDEEVVLKHMVSTWQQTLGVLQTKVDEFADHIQILDTQRVFEDWRAEANLRRKLRGFAEERNCQTKNQVLYHWTTLTADARQKALLAKRLLIQDFIAHWRNETKLRSFRDHQLRELKAEALTHWRLEQKLASYKRLCETRIKQGTLAKLRVAAAEAQAEAAEVIQTTDSLAERREKASILGIWRRRTNAGLDKKDLATDRHFFSVASACLEHWYTRAAEEAARIDNLRAFAARGAYYVATSNVLKTWAEITQRTRKERLTRTYHALRRRQKVNLVAGCLSRWRDATHDSHALSYDADNIHGGHLRDELADCVQLWRDATNMMQIMREVAITADQEVWWGKWSRRAKDLRDTDLDAADYCNDQTLSRCWRTWEFAMLQNKGRQHVVATLQENNNRKLCRQVLAQWSQKAAPDGTYPYPDLRSSVTSRRSVRYGNVRAVETPRFGGSINPAPSLAPVEQLPQIEEDLGDIYNASPQRQYGRASEPPRNPFVTAPKELSQSLPQRPRGYSKHSSPPVAATPQALAPISSFPTTAGIPQSTSTYMNAQQQSSQRQYRVTPFAPPATAQSPRPDFEDDISFAPSEGNDFPGTFMSTPTRRVGPPARSLSAGPNRTHQAAQQPAFRRPATVMPTTTTTTPSALLDTPYERQLRREYGTSAILASDRRSVRDGRMAATPRVTFADIKEESGEGMYEEEDAG
ncbi:Sfi1 spindle body protein-domain-containing protein [Coniochaeta sp. 2T2.1]|nr:Sfi1 spindle body protein-domain-containing protein [Coniochaeta sp. 2T2.1]